MKICQGAGHPGGPASYKLCQSCGETKANTTFTSGSDICTACRNRAMKFSVCVRGHTFERGKGCRECKRASDRKRAIALRDSMSLGARVINGHSGGENPLDPKDELARTRKKYRPNEAEWEAVQRAAEKVGAFQESKGEQCSGNKRYEGVTAWQILEEATGGEKGDHKRFHQLCAMATLQNAVWQEESGRRPKDRNATLPADFNDRARQMWRSGQYTKTAIAFALGVDPSVITKALAGERAA